MAISDPLAELGRELTQNGLAFLHRSVTEMSVEPPTLRTLSFAVVDLAAAVEVLLKARLVREHWTLICLDPDKATTPDLLLGAAKTVTPEQAIKRLENVAAVGMRAGGHADRVIELTRLRNRAVHFAMVGIAPAGLQGPLGRGLDFALWFLDTEFRDQGDADVQDLVEESIEALTTKVGQLKDLVDARRASIADELATAELCVQCPRCHQATLMLIDGETSRCAFCLWKPADGDDCASEYVATVLGLSEHQTIKDGGDWPVHQCTACKVCAMVEGITQLLPEPASINRGEPACDWVAPAHWGCFSCGASAGPMDLHHCDRCGALTELGGDDGSPVCAECWAYVTLS